MTEAVKAAPLRAAFAKIKWATTQIELLSSQIKEFLEANPLEVTTSIEADIPRMNPIKVWRFSPPREVPGRIYAQCSVILGLLREPLDQAISAIHSSRNKSESGLGFIFGTTKDDFEISITKSRKIDADVRAFIEECEPYLGGKGNLIAQIHYLKNPDKHRSSFVQIVTDLAMEFGGVSAFDTPLYTFGPRKGEHMIYNPLNGNLEQKDPERRPVPVKKNGVFKSAFHCASNESPKNRLEIATSHPDANIQIDFDSEFSITFSESYGLYGDPADVTLAQARNEIEEVLHKIKNRFFIS